MVGQCADDGRAKVYVQRDPDGKILDYLGVLPVIPAGQNRWQVTLRYRDDEEVRAETFPAVLCFDNSIAFRPQNVSDAERMRELYPKVVEP